MIVKTDTTDEQGVRHLEIVTDARGNDQDGYKAAERQAKQWFFRNYGTPENIAGLPLSDQQITEIAIKSGHLDPYWLESLHPQIRSGREQFMFGHHTGINPATPESTWGFDFEIVPVN
jgi:hypothetical protein